MNEITVYQNLSGTPDTCLKAIKDEIGLKIACVPFAVKLIGALRELQPKTDDAKLKIANTLLSGLQTLWQGGITAEDYDKIDFVNRGGSLVPSARVEAFYRAAARKGYRITDTIIAVPKEDADTTYFKENFYNGDIVYTLEDNRINPDRKITAQRLIDKYFDKFICRIDIHDAKSNQRVAMTVCEMSMDDLLEVASVSEQGLYKSRWEEYVNDKKQTRKRKIITDELNSGAFWVRWTGEMVNKTVIRRALKRVKEVLPELTEAIYAFEQDEMIEDIPVADTTPDIPIPIQQNVHDVNIFNLTAEEENDCLEMQNLFKANPKLAEDKFTEIMTRFESGEKKQKIINDEYAAIAALSCSKTKWPLMRGYIENEENPT